VAWGQGRHSLLDRLPEGQSLPEDRGDLWLDRILGPARKPDYVGTDAKADIPLSANVRRYYNAGAPHNGGRGSF